MLESIILIPSFLSALEYKNPNFFLFRDLLLLIACDALYKCGIKLPKKVFVGFGMFILVSETINNCTYKMVAASESLKKTWIDLQKKQIRKLFFELKEKRKLLTKKK